MAMRTTTRRRFLRFTRKDIFELFICIALAGLFVLLSSGTAFGQGNVGINNPTPHAKSLLDLTSSDKGLLTPRLTAAQRTAMFPAPDATAKGMLVYQTDAVQGYYYYDGATWQMLQVGGTGWGLIGNAGTSPATNFIGTTDNQGFAIRTNNIERVSVAQNGKVGIGITSPNWQLDVLDNSTATGQMAIRNLNSAGWSSLNIFNHNLTGHAYFGMHNPSGVGFAGTNTASPFALYTSALPRLHVTAGGDVGIGTQTPTRLVEIASANQAVQRMSSASTVNGSVLELRNTTAGNNTLGAFNFLDGVGTRGQLSYHLTNGMLFNTNAAERMRIDLAGNVGVGTNAPVSKVHVSAGSAGYAPNASAVITAENAGAAYLNVLSGTSETGLLFGSAGVAEHGGMVYQSSTGLTMRTGGNLDRMRIGANGNVSIGTTALPYRFNVETNDVNVMGLFRNTNAAGWSGLHFHNLNSTGQAHFGFANASTATFANMGYAGTITAHPFVLSTNNLERLRIAADGNVGIGTNVTNVRLQVAADQADVLSNFYNSNATGYSGIHYDNNNGARAHMGMAGSTATFWANMGYAGTVSSHPFVLTTNNVERLRVDVAGNVGIGTTAPGYKLDVQDATQAVARLTSFNHVNGSVLVLNNTTVGTNSLGAINFTDGGTTWGQVGYHATNGLTLRSGNAERVRIATDGKVGIGTATPTSELEVNGFTKHGTNAPAIKQIEFTGTTATTEGAFVDIAHGLTASKIMDVRVLIEYTAGNWITTGYTINPEYLADYVIGATNIRLYNHNGSSGSILSKPVKILVTYKA